MRSQFTFYKSFDDVYQDLTNSQKLEFMNTMLDVQFLRVKVSDVSFKDTILKHIWNAQKHSIEKSIKGYLESQKNEKIKNPYLGIYDPLQTPSEGICRQDKDKGEVKGKVKGEDEDKKLLEKFKTENLKYSKYFNLAEKFIAYRRTIKKTISTTPPIKAFINTLIRLNEKGLSFQFCIDKMKESEWMTVKESYFNDELKNVSKPQKEFLI